MSLHNKHIIGQHSAGKHTHTITWDLPCKYKPTGIFLSPPLRDFSHSFHSKPNKQAPHVGANPWLKLLDFYPKFNQKRGDNYQKYFGSLPILVQKVLVLIMNTSSKFEENIFIHTGDIIKYQSFPYPGSETTSEFPATRGPLGSATLS